MSADTGLLAVIIIGGAIKGILDYLTANRAAAELKKIKNTTGDTHELVNGGRLVLLQTNATSARALAKLTGKKEHLRLAAEADIMLEEQTKRQKELQIREG